MVVQYTMPLPSWFWAHFVMNFLRADGLSSIESNRMLGRSKPVPIMMGCSRPRSWAISGTCRFVAVAVNAATTGREGRPAMNSPIRM